MVGEFDRLDEILTLHESGRVNAALETWKELPATFRVKVMQYVLFIQQNQQFHADTPAFVLVTAAYGEWRLDADKLHRLVATVGELVRAQHS